MADKWLSEKVTREEIDPSLNSIKEMYNSLLLENMSLRLKLNKLEDAIKTTTKQIKG